MAWRLARALAQLQTELDAAFPGRTKPDWTIGDQDHRNRPSDHNPNGDGVVCAIDVRSKRVAKALWDHIARTRDPRVKYMIHDSRIMSSTNSPWTARTYTGSNPHADHIHVSVGRGSDGSSTRPDLYDDRSPWGLSSDVNPEEQMLTNGDSGNAVTKIQNALRSWNADALPRFGADGDYGDETSEWVRRYQNAADIDVTGNVDGLTAALLLEYVRDHAAGAVEHDHDRRYVKRGTTIRLG